MSSSTINVSTLIDEAPVRSFHIKILILNAIVVAVDGMDAQILGFIAPVISEDWALPTGALGPVFGIGLFGMMIGSLIFGPIADRIGRKRVIVISTFFFGICTLATFTADSLQSLSVWRFLTGIGLGGAYPNAIALTAEFSPRRKRAMFVMLMFLGFGMGSAIGGVLAAAILPTYGWQALFIVAGIIPIVLAVVVARALPESLSYLILKGGQGDRVRLTVDKLKGQSANGDSQESYTVNETASRGIVVQQLFADGRGMGTLLLWVMFSGGLFSLYFLVAWLPTIINQLVNSIRAASLITASMQVAVTVATVLIAMFADRIGPQRILPYFYALAAVCIASIGLTASGGSETADAVVYSTFALMLAVVGAGFFVGGGQNTANALATIFYPASIRSTGVSWGHGVARIASIIGPVVGGMLLAANVDFRYLFAIIAIPIAISSVASMFFLRRYNTSLSVSDG